MEICFSSFLKAILVTFTSRNSAIEIKSIVIIVK